MMDWEFVKLSDLMTIVGGGTPKTSNDDYWNGSIPWLSVVDFNNDERWVNRTEKQITVEGLNQSSTKLLNKGDLIISARGTVGQLAQLGKDMAFNQSCYGLRAKLEIGNDFLYYLVKYSIRKLLRNVHGGVFDTITRNTFELIECQISKAKNERDEIAKTLSSLDQKITLLRQQNETLEEMAQTLFKRWFVDFEFPNEEGQPYRSAGGEMVASELGEIPLGWEVGMLKDIATINPREALRKKSIAPYIEMKSLSTTDMGIVNVYNREFKSGAKFRNKDILLARITPCLENGKTGYVDMLETDEVIGWGSTEFIVIRSKVASSEFLYSLARSNNFRDNVIINMTGSSGRMRVPNDIVENYKIAISPSSLYVGFENICSPLFKKATSNRKKIQTLTKLRDTLLPKLMSGEIRVPTALENKA